jgi:hypothetical protein
MLNRTAQSATQLRKRFSRSVKRFSRSIFVVVLAGFFFDGARLEAPTPGRSWLQATAITKWLAATTLVTDPVVYRDDRREQVLVVGLRAAVANNHGIVVAHASAITSALTRSQPSSRAAGSLW